jgi:uncharacterized protein YjbI with pentapeptide repeats
MKTIKAQRLGVLSRSFENGDACYFTVSVLVFFGFSPSPSSPLAEVDMWKFLATELGDEPVDASMLKRKGEVLVNGSAYPLGGPRVACAPRVAIGGVDKTLYVAGDRFWKGDTPSDPVPFAEMPITWERAFGGEAYPLNPVGKGFAPVSTPHGEVQFLPNVEDPKRLVRKRDDKPPPAGFGAYDFTWPQRFQKVGTYDAAWLKERFPGFAKDMDWSIWNAAPDDQQIPAYFSGDEPFTLEYLHPSKPLLEGRLPGVRARAFVTQKKPEGEVFREIPTRLDTVRLFPGAERGIVIFHGMIDVAEDDAADLVHLVLGCEDLGEEKPLDHYRAVLAKRLDKAKGAMFALRDDDLMPLKKGKRAPLAEDVADMQALVSTEGLLQKNMRRGTEHQHEQAKQALTANGLDPAMVPPLPPEEPPPDLDALPELVERMSAEAEKVRAMGEQKKAEAEAKRREMQQALGLEPNADMGGPPKPLADEKLAMLKELASEAKRRGVAAPEIDAAVADADLEARLREADRQMREAYCKFAHHFPEAARLDGDRAARVRHEVIERHRAGQSFAGCDFTGADLSKLDLTKADFKDALLERANLRGSELGGADFTGAVLARADLSFANLFAAKLTGANLGGAKLLEVELGGGVDLTGAVLTKADLTGARLHDARLSKVDLSEATLAGTDFSRAEAREINFIKTDLSGVKLGGADLGKCNFIQAKVEGVDFTGAKLVSALFLAAKGDGAVFRDADLTNLRVVKESSFERADFKGAKLDGANLRGTRLAGADFTGAKLGGADLSGCDLRGAKLRRAAAKGAQLVRADLTGAVMQGIDLMEGSLQKAILAGADLRGANLFRVDLAKARTDHSTNLEGANVKHVRVVPAKRGNHAPR